MAQTGYTPILIYSSSTGGNTPAAGNLTNSTLGSELAINITDGRLFYKDNANAVQVIGWKTTPTTAGGTGLTAYTAGDLLYYASGTTLSKLAIGSSTTILTSSGTAPQWSAASGITVGTATNIAGGAAGSVPYQTGAGATSLLAIGSAYQALQVNAGGTAPSWQPSATSVMTAQGDLLYASAANTLARLAKNTTATRYLANTGTTNNPQWDQVNLANGVTGTLPVGNGGTGQTSWTANGVLYASGTGTLASGSVLTFDGTTLQNSNAITSGRSGGSDGSFVLKRASDGVTVNTISVNSSTGAIEYNTAYTFHRFYNYTGLVLDIGGAEVGKSVVFSSGNLVQGTANKGVNFTANSAAAGMTSQLLNWYEEGTFTPSLKFGGGNTGLTGTFLGSYTRIGRQVFINIYIAVTAVGSSTGNANISGLPFTSNSANPTSIFMDAQGLTYTGSYLMAYNPTSATSLDLYQVSTSATTQLTHAAFSSSTYLRIAGSYYV